MKKTEFVIYRGERFSLQTTGRYFQSGDKNATERLLHRRVWSDHHGPIPDGYEVHHKNEDWRDSSIGNLECLPMREHQRAHMLARFKDPAFRAMNRVHLAKAIEKAKEWHASEAGIEWHRQHAVAAWKERHPEAATCTVCGAPYTTYYAARSSFCSSACMQKVGYQRSKTLIGTCALCGKEFNFARRRKTQECCSRICACKLKGLRIQALKKPP